MTPDLIARWNEPCPYYSSYPPLGRWHDGATQEAYIAALKEFFTAHPDTPVHLYVHIPYCAKLCWYCICNIKVDNNRERIQGFVDTLLREIDLMRAVFRDIGISPNIREIHLGGGTPSHLDHRHLADVVQAIAFFTPSALTNIANAEDVYDEFAMEIDPRTVTRDDLQFYYSIGVDRISFGVQDFDPKVQEAINRVQPFEMVRDLLADHPFRGVNFDLLFGLPHQTRETFRRTVQQTVELKPSRVTLIKYAHEPGLRKHMKMIDPAALPARAELPLMFEDAAEALMAAGYKWVGHDNFALPSDDLAASERVGRNFGGNHPGRTEAIIGLGPTSTSAFGRHYFQAPDLKDYTAVVNEGRLPVAKSYALTDEDMVRRDIIMRLQCDREVDFDAIEEAHGIEWREMFADETKALTRLTGYHVDREGKIANNGLLALRSGNGFKVTNLGRYFIRHICKVFDPALKDGAEYRVHGP